MSIEATEAVTPAVTTGLQSLQPVATSSAKDKDMFMKLLVAQLKYQDPMKPADTGEFLSQSAQFTSLEKMQDVADQTGLVLGAQMAFGATNMVGHQATYTLANGTQGSGIVHGVTFQSTGTMLDISGVAVPLVNVQGITDGQVTAVPTTTPSTTPSTTPTSTTPTSTTPTTATTTASP